jgi:glutaredoxin-like YruB-family protein
MTRIGQATSKHLEVLAEVYEKISEQGKLGVENAMEASLKGHEKAVEALKSRNALGNVPEEVSLPDQIPQEVRERIQIKVQVEVVLGGIDTSKSLRDICTEQGGTPEMCEEFPLEPFKSFEQIESFCIEKGGPSEICSSLEAKCREYGVTTANECFILLSVSSIKTYQSTELKAVPAPTLPEEGIQQENIQAEPKEQSIETEKRLKQRYIPGASKVIIYSMPTCPHCGKAKQWFQQHNIDYEEIDISQNETVQNELMEKVGQLAVPVIKVEDDLIVGFNEENFSDFFGVD